jgi:hypothetical protein
LVDLIDDHCIGITRKVFERSNLRKGIFVWFNSTKLFASDEALLLISSGFRLQALLYGSFFAKEVVERGHQRRLASLPQSQARE